MLVSKGKVNRALENWVTQLMQGETTVNLPETLSFLQQPLTQLQQQVKQLQQEVDTAKIDQKRLHQYSTASGAGLWDLTIEAGDPTHKNNQSYYTARFRELVGYKDERDFPNTSASWFKILHPDDVEGLVKAFSAHISDKTGKTAYNHEFRMKHRQGHYCWFNVQGECIRDSKGQAISASGSVINIDIRKNTQLSQEAQAQQRSVMIVETADVISEVTQSMQSSMTLLSNTQSLVSETQQQIEKGTQSVKNMSELIHKVSDKNTKINSIVDGIQAIAEQTNLLALNAAIESARAGEHGRGFAVVADEVRNLAHNSESSTKEIIELVHNTVKDTQQSVAISDQVQETMLKISASMHDLQAAASTSSESIQQQQHKIMQIDQLMQQH